MSRARFFNALYPRLAAAFAVTLLVLCAGLVVVAYTTIGAKQREVVQSISGGLAAHIAGQTTLIEADGHINDAALHDVFNSVMKVNPSVEVYLLDPSGRVLSASPEGAPVQREYVALEPIRDMLADAVLPLFGDDPRNPAEREVFAVAPVMADGQLAGYLYIVLLGDMYRQMVNGLMHDGQLLAIAGAGGFAVLVALLFGLWLFARITQPLQRLADRAMAVGSDPQRCQSKTDGDEIGILNDAFSAMEARIARQFDELQQQHERRRELVANISHDLRTPLTAMQNYLETLHRLGDNFSSERRREYVDIALRHSLRVSRMAQQLFELAQLESEDSPPNVQPMCVAELLHDIAEKFSLSAERAGVGVGVDADSALIVEADMAMIERLITNLVENALRFTRDGDSISIEARPRAGGVDLIVRDTGAGIQPAMLPALFDRQSPLRRYAGGRHGGLGLLICARIARLHGSELQVASEPGRGTAFSLLLPMPAPTEPPPLQSDEAGLRRQGISAGTSR